MKARIIDVKPDAPGDPWDLFIEDDTGQPVSLEGESTFVVKVRTAATVVSVAGSMTAHAAASVTNDRDQADDVPTLRFAPVAASLAAVPAVDARAQVIVLAGTGETRRRYEFPAQVVP